jgi:hypothetical protein
MIAVGGALAIRAHPTAIPHQDTLPGQPGFTDHDQAASSRGENRITDQRRVQAIFKPAPAPRIAAAQ